MFQLGINPTQVFTPSTLGEEGKLLALGTVGRDHKGNEYILLLAAGAIAVDGHVGFWDENYTFTALSTSNDVGGTPLAVSRGQPTASGQRFWAQREGLGTVRVLASAAADVALESTATAGVLDDSVTTGSFAVEGLHLMTANAASEGSIQARISSPHLAYLARA